MEKLKGKLLEFAGFKKVSKDPSWRDEQAWEYPDGEWDYESDLPNFPEDETACFKWLVPKLAEIPSLHIIDYQYIGFSKDIDLLRHSWSIILRDDEADYSVSNNNPALALCLAIEKLIDGEKGDGDGK